MLGFVFRHQQRFLERHRFKRTTPSLQAFDAVKGFDEDFFLYFEDYDLSLRLASRGHLSYQPAVRIVHHGGFAARKGWRHLRLFAASALRFFSRHGWRW